MYDLCSTCLFLIWLTVFALKTGLLPFGRDLTFPDDGVTCGTGEVDKFPDSVDSIPEKVDNGIFSALVPLKTCIRGFLIVASQRR